MTVAHEVEIETESGGGKARGRRSSPSAPQPGPRTLGRYELRHQLATGGMASVHVAVTHGTGGFQKVFALKRMHPHLEQDRDFVEMFLDEARIAARVDHPNVCAVFDFGECAGEHFMAMELLMGEPYGKVLRRVLDLPAEERATARSLMVSLLADACEGLHAAHELRSPDGTPLDVVHRDISPHNLVVTYNGVLKVVDFGVARAAEQHHQTTTGTVKGKFGYMSPEQMRGQPVDRTADVWSLGVVLWESLTGRSLFRRATQSETVLAVTSGEVPSLVDLDPALDPELDAIVQRALAPDPARRFADAREMGRVLRRWLADRGGLPDTGDAAEWMRRLFPGGLEEKRALVRRVLSEPAAVAPPLPATVEPAGQPSHSTVVGRSPPSRAARRSWPWVVLPLLLAGAVGAGLAVWLVPASGDGPGAPVEPARDEPARADPPRADPARAETPTPGVPSPAGPEADPGREAEGAVRAVAPGPSSAPAEASPTPEGPSPARPSTASEPSATAAPAGETGDASEDEERPARVRPRGYGQVNVAARGGWAQVFVGRRHLGPTPGSYRLPAGRHVLRFRSTDGRVLARAPVHVRRGRTARVTVELEP